MINIGCLFGFFCFLTLFLRSFYWFAWFARCFNFFLFLWLAFHLFCFTFCILLRTLNFLLNYLLFLFLWCFFWFFLCFLFHNFYLLLLFLISLCLYFLFAILTLFLRNRLDLLSFFLFFGLRSRSFFRFCFLLLGRYIFLRGRSLLLRFTSFRTLGFWWWGCFFGLRFGGLYMFLLILFGVIIGIFVVVLERGRLLLGLLIFAIILFRSNFPFLWVLGWEADPDTEG